MSPVRSPPPPPAARRLELRPPPRTTDPGQSGTIARQELPHVPVLDDPTPKNTNPTLVVYQALCAVFDEATPAQRLELVELGRLFVGLPAEDRRRVLELAARLAER